MLRAVDWLRTVREVPNHLPQHGTSFVGREREMDEVRDQLAAARLLTLLGMGGFGKTRLSLQVAADMLGLEPAARAAGCSRMRGMQVSRDDILRYRVGITGMT